MHPAVFKAQPQQASIPAQMDVQTAICLLWCSPLGVQGLLMEGCKLLQGVCATEGWRRGAMLP